MGFAVLRDDICCDSETGLTGNGKGFQQSLVPWTDTYLTEMLEEVNSKK